MGDLEDGVGGSAPPVKRRGRPRKTKAEKRATRNKRDRERRKERSAGRRAVAKSPFVRGFAKLDATPDAPALSRSTVLVTAGTPAVPSVDLLWPLHPSLTTTLTKASKTYYAARTKKFKKLGAKGVAKNTIRSMIVDWRHWQAYCLETGAIVLPVQPVDLCDFLRRLIDAGYKRAPLSHLLSTLAWIHAWYELPAPLSDPATKAWWRDRCSDELVLRQHQALGLTMAQVHAMCDAADLSNPVHVRDVAIVRLAYDLLARPSEIAALTWGQVKPPVESNTCIELGRTKTDQEGAGVKIAISADTTAALEAWRAIKHKDVEALFHAIPKKPKTPPLPGDPPPPTPKPMGKHAVGKAMERLARNAGLTITHFSGHSGRVGAAQDLNAEGFTMAEIMQLGRWKNPAMPARYAEHLDAERAAQKRFRKIR